MNIRHVIMPAFFLCSMTVVAGCSGGGGSSLFGGGGSNCSPSSYSLQYPSAGGFSASGQINAATGCFSSATVKTYAATSPFIGLPLYQPGALSLLYLGVNFSTTEYANGLPSLSITMPSTVATSGHQFYLAHYTGIWTTVAGPVSANGSTVSFPTSNGNTTFSANTTDEVAIYRI